MRGRPALALVPACVLASLVIAGLAFAPFQAFLRTRLIISRHGGVTPTACPTATATPEATPTPTPEPVHVVRTYPIDRDSDVGPEAALGIVFDQPMDTDPGSLGFTLTPAQSLTAEWPEPGRLELRGGHWQPGTTYQLTLDRASSRQGGALAEPLTLIFAQGGQGAPIPILMYHTVGALRPNPTRNDRECAVSPDAFVAHLDLLGALHAHVVPLGEAVDYLSAGRPLPPRPVVLTFDDAGENAYSVAAPLLRERRMTATLFVISGYVGARPYYTGWGELRALAEQGFTLGSHTRRHVSCAGLSAPVLQEELCASRQAIERETGSEVLFFAYPYGVYTDAAAAQLSACGYRAALAVGPRVHQRRSRLFAMPRIHLVYGDPPDKLAAYLAAWEAPLPAP